MKAKRVLAPGAGRRRILARLGRAAPEEAFRILSQHSGAVFLFCVQRTACGVQRTQVPRRTLYAVRFLWYEFSMSLVVTFGETMLRLAPPGFERFLQSPQFVATFGGGEANVAVAVAQFGLPAAYCTVLPPNHPIADACVGELRRFGVDTSKIVRAKGRM